MRKNILFLFLLLATVISPALGVSYDFSRITGWTPYHEGDTVVYSHPFIASNANTTQWCNNEGYGNMVYGYQNFGRYSESVLTLNLTGGWDGVNKPDFGLAGGTGLNGGYSNTYTFNSAFTGAYPAIWSWIYCYDTGSGGAFTGHAIQTFVRDDVTVTTIPPVANFTGHPLAGSVPIYVLFTDNSTNAFNYNWSITGPGIPFIQEPFAKDTQVLFTVPGNYTISHGVNNTVGSDIETKTDYIWVYDDNSTATTQYGVLDYVTGYQIQDATINLQDIENSSWSNSTTPNNGFWSITTLLDHTINAYASAPGFEDNDRLNDPAWDDKTYWIMLHPVNWTTAGAGNVTLFVNVWDKDTLARINGAAVTIATPTYTQGKWTNSAGVAQFEVPNQTSVLVDVKALGQGYKGAVKMVDTGDGSGGDAAVEVTFLLEKNTVTPTPAVTTLPGGGTPTAATTADPYPCDADHPENCARKQDEMANMVVQFGPLLVNLFIIATVIGVMKMMGVK